MTKITQKKEEAKVSISNSS